MVDYQQYLFSPLYVCQFQAAQFVEEEAWTESAQRFNQHDVRKCLEGIGLLKIFTDQETTSTLGQTQSPERCVPRHKKSRCVLMVDRFRSALLRLVRKQRRSPPHPQCNEAGRKKVLTPRQHTVSPDGVLQQTSKEPPDNVFSGSWTSALPSPDIRMPDGHHQSQSRVDSFVVSFGFCEK